MSEGEIICQQYPFHPTGKQLLCFNPFVIDLTEIRQKYDAAIPFTIKGSQLLICFMLEGSFLIKGKDEQLSLAHNTVQFCMLGPADYFLEVKAGHQIVLIINIDLAWLKQFFKKEKAVMDIVRLFKAEQPHFRVSAPCRMSPVIHKWLSDIYNYSEHKFPIIDAILRISLSQILIHYNKVITNGEFSLAEEIKLYIDQNYDNPNLNLEMLANAFKETRQKLRRHFKSKYGLNIRQYYISLRVKHARQSLRLWGGPLTDIYKRVGYRNVSSLRSALKKADYSK